MGTVVLEQAPNLWALAISGVAILVAGASAFIALRAHRATRLYKDPYFVIRFSDEKPPGGLSYVDGEEPLFMKLENRGETRATNVRLTYPFDPTGIVAQPPKPWPIIDRENAAIFATWVKADGFAPTVWTSQWAEGNKGRYALVTFDSPTKRGMKQIVAFAPVPAAWTPAQK